MYFISLDDMMWQKAQRSDNWPKPRAWHSACEIGFTLYMFGGLLESRQVSNELLTLDIRTMTWASLALDFLPSPRCGHVALVAKGFLLVFGGQGPTGECLNDTYVLDINEGYKTYRDEVDEALAVKKELEAMEIKIPPIPNFLTRSRFYQPPASYNVQRFR